MEQELNSRGQCWTWAGAFRRRRKGKKRIIHHAGFNFVSYDLSNSFLQQYIYSATSENLNNQFCQFESPGNKKTGLSPGEKVPGNVVHLIWFQSKHTFLFACKCYTAQKEAALQWNWRSEVRTPCGHDDPCMDKTLWDSHDIWLCCISMWNPQRVMESIKYIFL